MPRSRRLILLLLVAMVTPHWAGAATAESTLSYNRDIRPILSENCFYCHGQDANQRKADLQLNTREGQRSNGIVIPGNPRESQLVQRIFTTNADEMMPPPDSHRTLTPAQKDLIKKWIEQGAHFEQHWAFEAPRRPKIPPIDDNSVRNPIDPFVLAKLREHGLQPSPEADRPTLLRRVTLDLTGLPPTLEELNQFLSDTSPDAYEKVVDRLLQSPHYGERMAIPWLDAARYADSNGFQQDGDTFQWIWRDWVVRAINDDMPFDQFSIEQLAGDLLPNPTNDQKIATAFNRNHLINGEGGAIAEEQRNVILFDRVDVTATTWLGLTVACAQCHDHKYDPITQRDYYSLMAAFNNVSETGRAGGGPSRIRSAPPLLELKTPEFDLALNALKQKVSQAVAAAGPDWESQRNALQLEWENQILNSSDPLEDNWKRLIANARETSPNSYAGGRVRREFDSVRLPRLKGYETIKSIVAAQLAEETFAKEELPRVMIMDEKQPRDTHILDRGDYLSPKEKVTINTPAFLPPLPADTPANRLGLARWLFAPNHPLTARVQVNRMWQQFFGIGLVKTAEDLGVQSEVPIHQELLDWLAVEFRENGWRIKPIHRLIVTSKTYRQSSRFTRQHLEHDRDNRLLARASRFRLPSMILRDLALSASDLLDSRIHGKPVYPYQPEGIWDGLAITKERDFSYPQSTGPDLYRRSLYTFWRRTVAPANMFDASTRQICNVKPSLTNTPLHALTTLNDPTWVEAARVFAANLIRHTPDIDARFTLAWRRCLTRDPNPADLSRLRQMLQRQLDHYQADPASAKKLLTVGSAPTPPELDAIHHAAWTSVCLAIFNLDACLTRE
jgi:mono/diheme cytochrome c family protein